MVVPGLGDGSSSLFFTGGALRGDKTEVSHKTSWRRESANIVDFAQEGQGSEGFDATQATESFDLRSVGHGESGTFEFGVESLALRLEILKMFEFDGQSGLERTFEGAAELGQPESVLLGPGGLALGEDKAMVAENAGDPMFGGGAVDLIAGSQAEQSTQGFLVFGRHMDGGEMSAAVEPREHDGIETISLATVARFSRNERRGNHVTMKTVVGEHTLQDETSTGSFVTSADGGFVCQAPEELAHLHQIAG
jgi:hypothetical protein